MAGEWKKLFPTHILQRGQSYFEEERVFDLKKNQDKYTAYVEGNENYYVEILLQDGKIREMSCNCPYSADGEYCKHMAAVLYAIDAEGPKLEEKSSQEENRIASIVALIPEKDLRSLVLSLAREDNSLQNAILSKYSKSLDSWQMKSFRDEFNDILESVSDRYGYIDYEASSSFEYQAEEFLKKHTNILIEKKLFREAFEVTKIVYEQLGDLEIDDSNGTIMTIAEDCYEIWRNIFEKCSREEEQEMFEWMLDNLNSSLVDYMEDSLIDFWMEEFPEIEHLQQKLAFLDGRIERLQSNLQNRSDYEIQKTLMYRLKVMEELGCSREECLKFMIKYHQYSCVRKWEIDLAVKEKRYDNAISLLRESKELDSQYPGLVSEYSQQIMELYQSRGQTKEYKEELIYYVIEKNFQKIDYALKLKQVCTPDEWKNYRAQLLKTGYSSFKYKLMKKEGMYRQLLDAILSSKSIYSLDQYERTLKDKFPDEVRNMYFDYVKSQAVPVSDRKTYQVLVKYLAKAAQYPGGRPLAEAIADEWRVSYKRRRAMMEELDKGGFAVKK